jgi:YihY family inner membrane protein
MIYRVVPNRQIDRRDRTIGAILAAFGFELVKIGFTIYVANFGSYQQVYGAIGGIVAFLVFGAMVDVKMLALLRTTFTTAALARMTAVVALACLVLGFGVNLVA